MTWSPTARGGAAALRYSGSGTLRSWVPLKATLIHQMGMVVSPFSLSIPHPGPQGAPSLGETAPAHTALQAQGSAGRRLEESRVTAWRNGVIARV